MNRPQPLEFALTADVSVFGELWLPDSPRGSVLLLHDRGSDLDSTRAFAEPLRSLELGTVLLDMPGHGLSGGDWDTHGAESIRLGLGQCSLTSTSVGVIAIGAAANLLLSLHPAPVGVAALIAPGLSSDELLAADLWRVVPQVWIGDPCDSATDQTMDILSKWIHAWSMRLFVHYLDGDGSAAGEWTPHMTHSAAAFIAEQLAYLNAGPRVGPSRPSDNPAEADKGGG